MVQILKNSLILIDGSFYLYRAYHAFPSLTNSAGDPTGAMYGLLSILRKIILRYQPIHAAIIFDTHGKTFRNRLFKDYKSHRMLMPYDLRVQIKPLYAIIKAMGLPLIAASGVEADDVIGTLAHEAEKIGYPVLISTGDKDMAQLVTSRTTIINSMTNTLFGPEEVEKKYGVPPEFIIDYLALIGDPSDNIPGVPGIGEKTVQMLLRELGGLDMIYARIDRIAKLRFRGSKTIATKLQKNKEIAYLSYQLAAIKTSVKLNINCKQLVVRELKEINLLRLFKKYEFKRWIIDLKKGQWIRKN